MGEVKENVSAIEAEVWSVLKEVMDPEIPVLSLVDLGMIPEIRLTSDSFIRVNMTPTFSGCPAVNYMKQNIIDKMKEKMPDYTTEVIIDYERTWNTNLITDKGREALKTFGLTPPRKYEGEFDPETMQEAVCPYCGSAHTSMNSMFGPTLCRSIHYCFDCKQSFQQFKPL